MQNMGGPMTIDETVYNRMPAHLQALFNKLPNPGSVEVLAAFAQAGEKTGRNGIGVKSSHVGYGGGGAGAVSRGYQDTGSAARFFYTSKASAAERADGLPAGERNIHPTTKPLSLMRYLVRLITPPVGLVLDPFLGSGTTAVACAAEGVRCVGIEREAAYMAIAHQRVTEATRQLNLFTEATS